MDDDFYYDSPYFYDRGVRLNNHPYYNPGGVRLMTHPPDYAAPLPISPVYDQEKTRLLVWECEYCGNEHPVDTLVCRGCGASRVAANVRAFWILE